MKNKIFISILLIILLSVLGVFLYNRNSSSPTTNNDQAMDSENSLSVLQAIVIDSETKKPIINTAVYLGTGKLECLTNDEGECQIKDFSWGDYSLSAHKKGYERFTDSKHFEKGENNITIKLKKQPSTPESLVIEGTIIIITTAEGTRSENNYFKIRDLNGNEEYLFNEVEHNEGFGLLDKKVKITGYKGTGFIGWQSDTTEGIFVETIEEL